MNSYKEWHNLYACIKKSKYICVIALILIVAFLPASSSAIETPVNQLQSRAAQKQTVLALQAIDQNRWSVAERAIANTRDPLAAKLFYWLTFTKKSDVGNYTRLTQFIRHNPEWPGISTLQSKAEEAMPDSLPPQDVIAWFSDYEPRTAIGLDRYLSALTGTGRKNEAAAIMRKWWADMRLTRDEQRELYRKYGRLIDREAHTRRLDTLLFSGQYTNARAIADVLGAGYRELTEARIALAAQKDGVNALISRVPPKLQNDPGLRYERLRWRRRNDLDVGAMEILNTAPRAEQIQNPEAWWRERHILIRRLLEKKHYKSAYLLANTHRQKDGFPYAQAQWMAGWMALRFVDKPTEALRHFTLLYQSVTTPVSKARGAYWAGRASEAIQDDANAKIWYQKAAQFQTVYYGQLAGAKLGLEEALPNAAPPILTDADKAAYERRELIQAARLFHDAGMRDEATRFLRAFVAQEETPKAYRYAADTAADMKSHYDALRIAKDATRNGLFLTAQAYPVITGMLRGIDTEWALIHGLIRQESMFDHKAQSPVGALGLMQLMPATARETAGKLGIAHQQSWLTLRPDHNIRLGNSYISRMLDRYDGSYPLAIAAYNAGPGRVDQWLQTFGDPRQGEVDWIDWIESMPIYETRNYVQRVLEAVYVYRLRLKGVQPYSPAQIHIALAR